MKLLVISIKQKFSTNNFSIAQYVSSTYSFLSEMLLYCL